MNKFTLCPSAKAAQSRKVSDFSGQLFQLLLEKRNATSSDNR